MKGCPLSIYVYMVRGVDIRLADDPTIWSCEYSSSGYRLQWGPLCAMKHSAWETHSKFASGAFGEAPC
eukprot:2912375-Pyramimonas_sp.AAC.1